LRWQIAAAPGASACGGLHCFPLDLPAAQRESLASVLSATEAARASRFLAAEHGEQFTVAHGRLRLILAAVLQVRPSALRFAAGAHGKPELSGAEAASGLRFNLSHSGAWGFVGWAFERDIGVDIECWRSMRDMAALVRRYFSPAEIAAWEALPPERRSSGFFNAWTRKEAYVKAIGRGLALPLASFDVSLGDGAEARLLRPSALAGDGREFALAAPTGPADASLAVVLQSETLYITPLEVEQPAPKSG
jgi:4'-phosphopantetheinyl transferase